MLRAGVASLALVALVCGAPTPTKDEALRQRQWQIGDPSTATITWGGTGPTAIPTSGPGILPPVTGGLNPPPPRRQDIGPVLGGSDLSAQKSHIVALELEYERLVQQYGNDSPPSVVTRKKEIEDELKIYGITIVQTPDGTSTIIAPGKTKRHGPAADDMVYRRVEFDVTGLRTTLESLWHQYGPNPPHDIYVVEEKIKHVLLACGASTAPSPDGNSTTTYPSTKRSDAGYDIEKLESILESLLQEYDSEPTPPADWLVIQHTAAVLKSYCITNNSSLNSTVTILDPNDEQAVTIAVGDSVNIIALQALMALLEATYGSAPPRDILLIEQTIATILSTQGTIIPGFPIPGGPLSPDPTVPGGAITPDPTVPGGSLEPSTKRSTPDFDVGGLQAALGRLEAQYGTYDSDTVHVYVFIIMQNIATILQA